MLGENGESFGYAQAAEERLESCSGHSDSLRFHGLTGAHSSSICRNEAQWVSPRNTKKKESSVQL